MPIPENNVRFTDLSNGTVKAGSIFATSEPDSSTPPSYDSTKVTAQEVGNFVATSQTYSGLSTVAKTLVGAINEAAQGGGGGSSTLAGLSDVTITNPTDGQSLIYDIVYKVWKNGLPRVRRQFQIQGDVGDSGCYIIGNFEDWVYVDDRRQEMLMIGSDADGNEYSFQWFGNYSDLYDTEKNHMMFGRIYLNDAGQTVVQTAKVTANWLDPTGRMDVAWDEHIVPMTKEVSGTLTAGSTSLTLSDAAITTSSTLQFFTDIFGVAPTAATVSTGSVTLTFEAQASNMTVKVRVS